MPRPAHFLTPLLRPSGSLHLRAEGLAAPLATKIEGAFDSASRKRGLLGRARLADGEALVIAPCSAVHTFRMRFALDLIFASRAGEVIKICQKVPPNRVRGAWGAFAVVELPAGSISRTGLERGNLLQVGPPRANTDERSEEP